MAEHEHENVPALPIAARMRDPARPKPHIGPTMADYKKVHAHTVGNNSDDFWRKVRCPRLTETIILTTYIYPSDQAALDMLYWNRPFTTVRAGGFKDGDIVWFPEGGLNASYNCLDRWAHKKPDAVSYFLVSALLRFRAGTLHQCHSMVTRT